MSYVDLAPIISGVGINQTAVDNYFDNLEEPSAPATPPEITSQKIVALANIYFEGGQVGKGIAIRNGLRKVADEVGLWVSQVKAIIKELNRLYSVWSSAPIFRYAFGTLANISVGQAVNVACDKDNTVDSFSISPDFPAGLSLDTSTDRISGTATESLEETTYVITGTNDNGEGIYTFNLTVGEQ